ncbi:unnamed protein product [Diatraea saccharalis]|uniref:Uncharacterized protein n=1 Tax=Diatraea saccharalis TaxID=40085 RepID=A0A9N9RAT5_9NEOP|nr:unnamed protein product [Diatraea saccharalis]
MLPAARAEGGVLTACVNREESSQDSQRSDPSTTENRPQSRSSNNSSSTRRRKRSSQEEPITCALARLENISSAINTQSNCDEFHYFAQNVAAQLRALPLYEALDVQNEIQKILTAARRRYQYPNLSSFTSVTYTPPATNIQTMTFIPPPTTNTQTFIPSNTITDAVTYTPPTINTQTMTNTQTITFIPSSTNTNTVTYTFPYSSSQSDSTVPEEDLLNKAWKTC